MVNKTIVDLDFNNLDMITRNISSFLLELKENLGISLSIVKEFFQWKKKTYLLN